ncbi:DUF748 domain-containing protein [Geotalea toluenoxydans]|uniref:DUF748 domain-containing protein n=1 Tax=Geotalea toluenoxydans TaxID=421624 RepID=UPI0006D18248|nr:DUF748 domain-containing protein [Geotalea toluenoxydans]
MAEQNNSEDNSKDHVSGKPVGEQRFKKALLWVFSILLFVAVVLYVASFFLDEPLRRYTEKTANKHLKGYSISLSGMHLQLVGGTVTLDGLKVLQDAHPVPPIAVIPNAKGSISWRDLLYGRVVATIGIDRPMMHIDLQQLKSETASKEKLKDRGWQEAIEAVSPLKINNFVIRNASVTYVDKDAGKPLHLTNLNITAGNIRNVRGKNKVYPSSLHMDTVIFGSGRGQFDGNANFLSQPVPGIKGTFKLEEVPLDYFKPVASHINLSVRKGVLSLSGNMEYSPTIAGVQVKDLQFKGLEMDYVHSAATAKAEKKRAKKVGKAAGKVSNKPEIQLRIDRMRLTGSNIGVINKDADPPYRVFIAETDFSMTNLTNHFIEGPAKAELSGKFMGSGITKASAEFRPEKNGPDLDLQVKIEDTRLKDMNDLFRAYGNFDVSAGFFLFYADIHVRNDRVSGYLKPLFKDIKVYDRRRDQEKTVFHKLYEMLVGGVANLLENRPREEVATVVDIAGPVTKPQTSTWQVLAQLVTNAFFKAILPGFEREVTSASR